METWMAISVSGFTATVVSVALNYYNRRRDLRHSAIDLMKFFIEHNSPNSEQFSCLRKLMSRLGEDSCRAIWNGESFQVSLDDSKFVDQFFKAAGLERPNGPGLIVSDSECETIRSRLHYFLNLLEVIGAAYISKYADRDMLKKEFGPILKPPGRSQDRPFAFRTYLNVVPIYGSLREFDQTLFGP